MNDKARKDLTINVLEMYESLETATHQAGGCGWSVEELRKMTVVDLFSCLAINGIRFVYQKREKE